MKRKLNKSFLFGSLIEFRKKKSPRFWEKRREYIKHQL